MVLVCVYVCVCVVGITVYIYNPFTKTTVFKLYTLLFSLGFSLKKLKICSHEHIKIFKFLWLYKFHFVDDA